MQQTEVLIRQEQEYALVPTNPRLVQVAKRFHWKPATAIIRIKKALPALVEQQAYLALGDFGILPESMAKLLRLYLGHNNLKLEDLEPHKIGPNLQHSRFSAFAEFLRECMNILKIITNEYSSVGMSVENAGYIVLHYGTDDPEAIIELVDTNLEEMCEFLGVSSLLGYGQKMRNCIHILMAVVIPENRRIGMTDPLSLDDFFRMSSGRRDAIRRALSLKAPQDGLSEDFHSLRGDGHFDLLKREGVI